jgi:hypothetical protein
MLVLGIAAELLDGRTDGRSWAVLAIAGPIAVIDNVAYLRRDDVRAPKQADDVARPLSGVAGIVGGAALFVVGVLVAIGVVELA